MALKEGVKVFFIVLICILVLGFLLYLAMKLISDSNQDSLNQSQDYSKSVEIIDGDTFKLENGEIVRLLCVDTPEKNQEGYDEAVNFLEERLLFSNSEIRLEGNKTDMHGRSLRWVYVNNTLINKEIVDSGYGTLFEYNNEDCGLMK